jgi:phosphoribosylamine--glycine ligase
MAAGGLRCVSTSPVELEAELFVIGPEIPLVAGLANTLRAQGKVVFGPNADGAQLEGSKAYMKEFLASANVATAAYGAFSDVDEALKFLDTMKPPYVVKTDGLAAGKGVLVTDSLPEAQQDVRDKLSGSAFGAAGRTVVIEEGLIGTECSLLVLCDGHRAEALVPARDFKRVGNGDSGPNTGGMGAFAPLESMTADDVTQAMKTIVQPTMRELARRGIEYRGVLYAGIMMTADGPKLLEYNVRFGDPETEVIVPLISSDLFELLRDVAQGSLLTAPTFQSAHAVTIVLAAPGYPLAPQTGDVIEGLGDDGQLETPIPNVTVFHAGTKRNDDGQFVTAGGRVLTVTAVAKSRREARTLATTSAAAITFPGRVMRTDIAEKD